MDLTPYEDRVRVSATEPDSTSTTKETLSKPLSVSARAVNTAESTVLKPETAGFLLPDVPAKSSKQRNIQDDSNGKRGEETSVKLRNGEERSDKSGNAKTVFTKTTKTANARNTSNPRQIQEIDPLLQYPKNQGSAQNWKKPHSKSSAASSTDTRPTSVYASNSKASEVFCLKPSDKGILCQKPSESHCVMPSGVTCSKPSGVTCLKPSGVNCPKPSEVSCPKPLEAAFPKQPEVKKPMNLQSSNLSEFIVSKSTDFNTVNNINVARVSGEVKTNTNAGDSIGLITNKMKNLMQPSKELPSIPNDEVHEKYRVPFSAAEAVAFLTPSNRAKLPCLPTRASLTTSESNETSARVGNNHVAQQSSSTLKEQSRRGSELGAPPQVSSSRDPRLRGSARAFSFDTSRVVRPEQPSRNSSVEKLKTGLDLKIDSRMKETVNKYPHLGPVKHPTVKENLVRINNNGELKLFL